jgi:hypothetical protein
MSLRLSSHELHAGETDVIWRKWLRVGAIPQEGGHGKAFITERTIPSATPALPMKSIFSTIRQLVSRLQHIEEDRNELSNAPSQHEQVPDAVAVGQFSLERIENDPARVQQAAGKEPPESVQGQGPEQGFKSEDHEPSHEQVQDDRQNVPTIGKPEFNHDPRECSGQDTVRIQTDLRTS